MRGPTNSCANKQQTLPKHSTSSRQAADAPTKNSTQFFINMAFLLAALVEACSAKQYYRKIMTTPRQQQNKTMVHCEQPDPCSRAT